ncbi:MAG: hypothetical protein P4M09_23355 [Devosia sp.]|nr:hypothetical protein [Devosia sp.]
MSETSKISELANFVGRSKLNAEDPSVRRRAINALAGGFQPKLQRRSVAELLGVVLVLSARTRRLALPSVEIDLDVFSPAGGRAVRLQLGNRG